MHIASTPLPTAGDVPNGYWTVTVPFMFMATCGVQL